MKRTTRAKVNHQGAARRGPVRVATTATMRKRLPSIFMVRRRILTAEEKNPMRRKVTRT